LKDIDYEFESDIFLYALEFLSMSEAHV